jgi:hypothetical protein
LVHEQEPATIGEIYAYSTVIGDSNAITASSDPDTMYFHQAMKQEDAAEFLKTAHMEFENLLDRDVIEIIPAYLVPKGMRTFSAVWAMKRKGRVRTGEVYKYKARLNLDGSDATRTRIRPDVCPSRIMGID